MKEKKGNEQIHMNNKITCTWIKFPIKRHKVAEWIRKHDAYIFCLQETYLRTKDIHRLKEKGWKKTYYMQMDIKNWDSFYIIQKILFLNYVYIYNSKIEFKPKAILEIKKVTT